jgi:hypothetical protein
MPRIEVKRYTIIGTKIDSSEERGEEFVEK